MSHSPGSRILALCVTGLILSGLGFDRPVSAAASVASCDEQGQRLSAARELHGKGLLEDTVRVAGRVEFLPSCWLSYVRAQALLGWVLGLELGRFQEGVASYRRGLGVDQRQSRLWYELGYLFYQRSDYMQAMESLERALVNVQTTPPPEPERFMMQCRFLYADSADRMATRTLGQQALFLQKAVSSWQDFQDFCADYGGCEPRDLQLSEQRLHVLERQFKTGP